MAQDEIPAPYAVGTQTAQRPASASSGTASADRPALPAAFPPSASASAPSAPGTPMAPAVLRKALLDAAMGYTRRGWRVFPLHSATANGACTCKNAECDRVAKHPRTKNGLKDATGSLPVVREHWRRWPFANVGVVTGAKSGILVLDVDPRHNGWESLAELERRFAPLPATLTARTGGGGEHRFFAHPGGDLLLRNVVGLMALLDKLDGRQEPRPTVEDGLDIRGDGGYIVAAPSLHASGAQYVWQDADVPVAPLPAWLLTLLTRPRGTVAPSGVGANSSGGSGHATSAMPPADRAADARHWLEKYLAVAGEGNRNNTGKDLAIQLRDSARLTETEAEAYMLEYAERVPGPGYGSREALATLRSIYREPAREPARSRAALNGASRTDTSSPLYAPFQYSSYALPAAAEYPPHLLPTLPVMPDVAPLGATAAPAEDDDGDDDASLYREYGDDGEPIYFDTPYADVESVPSRSRSDRETTEPTANPHPDSTGLQQGESPADRAQHRHGGEREPSHTDESRPKDAPRSRFRLLTDMEVETMPPIEWLVAGLLPESLLSMVFGEYGSGKSFLTLDWALCVAAGIPWHGHKVKQGSVVYVAGEGVSGMRKRLKAWKQAHGLDGHSLPFYLIGDPPRLMNNGDVAAFIEAIKGIPNLRLVELDTLSRCIVGGDENSSKDMPMVVDNLTAIQRLTGAHVQVVHHKPKNAPGPRGSTSVPAGLDTLIDVTKDNSTIWVRCTKQKEAEEGKPLSFCLQSRAIDDDGRETSCVLVPTQQRYANVTPGERMLRILGAHPEGVSAVEWEREAHGQGISHSTFYDNMQRLQRQERIVLVEDAWTLASPSPP